MPEPVQFTVLSAVALWSLATAVHDVRTLQIPDVILYSGALAVCLTVSVAVLDDGRHLIGQAAMGAAVLFAVYLLLRLIAPSHLGGGDLRLAPLVGALGGIGGAAGVLCVAVVPFALTGICGAAVALGRRCVRSRRGTAAGRRQALAHGPSMVAAAMLVTFWVFTS